MFINSPLSLRQTQILNKIAEGLPNKLVADSFGIKEQTVKNHLISIMDKLGAVNRTHAVVIALLSGWLNVTISETQKVKIASVVRLRKHGKHKIYAF